MITKETQIRRTALMYEIGDIGLAYDDLQKSFEEENLNDMYKQIEELKLVCQKLSSELLTIIEKEI